MSYRFRLGPLVAAGVVALAMTIVAACSGNSAPTSPSAAQSGATNIILPPPPPVGNQGCSPGYWKNHTSAWASAGVSPSATVASVFSAASAFPDLGSSTLIEALSFGGGNGTEGGARILLRAAVAAYLNAASPDVEYPLTVASVVSQVNTALASGDRATMLTLASTLDADNNLGCPID